MQQKVDAAVRRLRSVAATVVRRARGLRVRGNTVECPCCDHSYAAFLPAGVRRRANALCPSCGSLERHRLLWLHARARTDLFEAPHRLLHVAPERTLRTLLRRLPNVTYRGVDLRSPLADDHADLTDLPYDDASFDVILCSHVLEHIPDDTAAMRELRRVLAPDGWAIVQVPLDESLERTAEDVIADPRERERRYGNRDHVRMYGRDYGDRLAAAGFDVEVDRFAYELADREVARYGLRPEPIHVCRRRPDDRT